MRAAVEESLAAVASLRIRTGAVAGHGPGSRARCRGLAAACEDELLPDKTALPARRVGKLPPSRALETGASATPFPYTPDGKAGQSSRAADQSPFQWGHAFLERGQTGVDKSAPLRVAVGTEHEMETLL